MSKTKPEKIAEFKTKSEHDPRAERLETHRRVVEMQKTTAFSEDLCKLLIALDVDKTVKKMKDEE